MKIIIITIIIIIIISQKLSRKLIMLPSYGITAYKQTEKSKHTSQT